MKSLAVAVLLVVASILAEPGDVASSAAESDLAAISGCEKMTQLRLAVRTTDGRFEGDDLRELRTAGRSFQRSKVDGAQRIGKGLGAAQTHKAQEKAIEKAFRWCGRHDFRTSPPSPTPTRSNPPYACTQALDAAEQIIALNLQYARATSTFFDAIAAAGAAHPSGSNADLTAIINDVVAARNAWDTTISALTPQLTSVLAAYTAAAATCRSSS